VDAGRAGPQHPVVGEEWGRGAWSGAVRQASFSAVLLRRGWTWRGARRSSAQARHRSTTPCGHGTYGVDGGTDHCGDRGIRSLRSEQRRSAQASPLPSERSGAGGGGGAVPSRSGEVGGVEEGLMRITGASEGGRSAMRPRMALGSARTGCRRGRVESSGTRPDRRDPGQRHLGVYYTARARAW